MMPKGLSLCLYCTLGSSFKALPASIPIIKRNFGSFGLSRNHSKPSCIPAQIIAILRKVLFLSTKQPDGQPVGGASRGLGSWTRLNSITSGIV
ncbi:hypothetical protein BR93DRAFT_931200, partial [Coniochaeta sp. PMI_546]